MSKAVPVCLITGSATGIGAACAREFSRHGWHVGISYQGEDQLQQAQAVVADCSSADATCLLQALDVRQDAECVRFAQAALQRFGRIDALVNCAGTTRFIAHDDLAALDADEFHRTYDVNVVGMHQMTRACAEALKASGAGSVVNISSIGGLLGRGSSVAYAASKGAVNTMTLALARALAPVRVNAIAPGFVADGLPSRLLDEKAHAQAIAAQTGNSVLRRISQPQEVAALAWFLTAHAPGITGDIVMLDNGLHLNAG